MPNEVHIAELLSAVVGLIFVASAVLAFSQWRHLPFTVMLVITGAILAELAANDVPLFHIFTQLPITADLILLLFLPTLIFESAFNLDSRQLRQNLVPILALAVPGVLLSTALLGGFLYLVTPFDLLPALILGAILSATDPVAVIALFKQVGAPKRLTILIEGESLFNDATAIVLTRILIAIILAGTVSSGDIVFGFINFFGVFLGGILVGWLAALVVGYLLGKVDNSPMIEIPLTVVLAYFSFLLAEELFHVSGVMATVAAAMTMGGWGRTKISPSVSELLTHLWAYFAHIANALIFLLVGLQVNFMALAQSWSTLLWVIIGMLLSRAIVVYSLVPLLGRLPNAQAISPRYQGVMYWGGLRGAIALALVLSLPDLPYKEEFIALITGAVIFYLISARSHHWAFNPLARLIQTFLSRYIKPPRRRTGKRRTSPKTHSCFSSGWLIF